MKKKDKEKNTLFTKLKQKDSSKEMGILSKKVGRLGKKNVHALPIIENDKTERSSHVKTLKTPSPKSTSRFKITNKITDKARQFDTLVRSLLHEKQPSSEKDSKLLIFNYDKGFTLADLEVFDMYPHKSFNKQ